MIGDRPKSWRDYRRELRWLRSRVVYFGNKPHRMEIEASCVDRELKITMPGQFGVVTFLPAIPPPLGHDRTPDRAKRGGLRGNRRYKRSM